MTADGNTLSGSTEGLRMMNATMEDPASGLSTVLKASGMDSTLMHVDIPSVPGIHHWLATDNQGYIKNLQQMGALLLSAYPPLPPLHALLPWTGQALH